MTKYICDGCKQEVPKRKELKKLNEGRFCKFCARNKRKEFREKCKETIMYEDKREAEVPKIKNESDRTPGRISAKGLYLTKDEKNILYRKYLSEGFGSIDASDKVKEISERMKSIVNEMREKKKTDKEINKKFKEEFAKLISR